MKILSRIFGKGQETLTDEEKKRVEVAGELEEYIVSLNAPRIAKCWLEQAVKSAYAGERYEYEKALGHINPEFVTENFTTRTEVLLKVRHPEKISYWLQEAEKKAREGDLDYRIYLDSAQRCAGDQVIEQEATQIKLLFARQKWSKIPPHLEDLLRSAVGSMANGEPQDKVDYHLNKAEEYAGSLGYTIRGKNNGK